MWLGAAVLCAAEFQDSWMEAFESNELGGLLGAAFFPVVGHGGGGFFLFLLVLSVVSNSEWTTKFRSPRSTRRISRDSFSSVFPSTQRYHQRLLDGPLHFCHQHLHRQAPSSYLARSSHRYLRPHRHRRSRLVSLSLFDRSKGEIPLLPSALFLQFRRLSRELYGESLRSKEKEGQQREEVAFSTRRD